MGELKNKGREGVKENQDKYQEIHEGAEQSLEERNRKDRKSTRLNSSHQPQSRMPSSA